MELINTADATPPAGHYSQAVRANGFVFVSGQLGFLAPAQAGAKPQLAAGASAQTEEALRSVKAILTAAGASFHGCQRHGVHPGYRVVGRGQPGLRTRLWRSPAGAGSRAHARTALRRAGRDQRGRGGCPGLIRRL